MAAYYNEFDKFTAQWLRNLIAAGHIAPGDVDDRDIQDVHPNDLKGYTQCHFFAGLGVWSYALRRAGWDDDRPVWTASCPCQPFSAAGKGDGFDDERHLWPSFHHLVAEHNPPVILGEQVASKGADDWIDLVQADLEGLAYAFGAVAFPSASVGAPHIRDRIYWTGHGDRGGTGRMGNTDYTGLEGHGRGYQAEGGRVISIRSVAEAGKSRRVADSERRNPAELARARAGAGATQGAGQASRNSGRSSILDPRSAGPVNGVWRNADWLLCRDAKWRPVESGTFPLANGSPARVGRLRAYGNAINAEQAAEFIRFVMALEDAIPL